MSDTAQAETEAPMGLGDKMAAFMEADDLDDVKFDAPKEQDAPRTDDKPLESPMDTTPSQSEAPKVDDKLSTPLDNIQAEKPSEKSFDSEQFDQETWKKLEEMGTDPHAGIKFKELRDELKALKAKEFETHQSIESSEEVQQLKARLDSLQEIESQYQEMRNKAALADYTQTDEYRARVEAPFSNILNNAAGLESHLGLEENAIMKAIAHSDRHAQDQAIEQITRDIPPRYAREIEAMASQIHNLYAEEDYIKQTAAERLDRYRESEQARLAAENEKYTSAYRSNVKNTFEKYQNKIPTLLDNEGNPIKEYNDMLGKAEALDFNEMDVESKSFAAMSAVVVPHLVSQFKGMEVKLKEANTLISQLRANNPSNIGGQSSGSNSGNGQEASAADRMKRFLDMDNL